MACDADTHYMCNAVPYLGKGTVDLPKGTNLGEYLVLQLTRHLTRHGRTVTCDNWFTSLPLALSLRKGGLELVGTIKQKPYIPKEVILHDMAIGASLAVYNFEHDMTLQVLRSNPTKRVLILSSIHHHPSIVEGEKTDLQMFYNATKGGVDTFDQLCSLSTVSRKTRRWPLCIFYGMLNIAMNNAFILYNLKEVSSDQHLTRRQFYRRMSVELSQTWVQHRNTTMKTMPTELRNLMQDTFNLQHFHSPVPEDTPNRKLDKRQRCRLCPPNTNHKTRILCTRCKIPVCSMHEVPLCCRCTNIT